MTPLLSRTDAHIWRTEHRCAWKNGPASVWRKGMSRGKPAQKVTVGIALALSSLGCSAEARYGRLSDAEGVPLGSIAPEFHLASFDPIQQHFAGEELGLHADWLAEGNPIVLNFWATWCGPCIVELAYFEELAEERPDLTVATVAVKDTTSYLPRYVERSGLTLPVMVDPSGVVSAKLDSNILPTTLVFGSDGTLLTRFVGSFYSSKHLSETVDRALSEADDPEK